MTSPLVSVILCTYNDEAYIKEAIGSILNQTFTDFEFIIINDGSTDQTGEIIQSFQDLRIRYVAQTNQGLELSKNRGLNLAKGAYIAYMDGDDISDNRRLEQQVQVLEQVPEIGICGTGLDFFPSAIGEHRIMPVSDTHIKTYSLFGTPLNHPTCMIRKHLLNEHNIRYKQGWLAAEDYHFMLQILEYTRAYSIPVSLYHYRWHDSNTSLKKVKIQQKNTQKISFLSFNQQLNMVLSEEEHEQLFQLFNATFYKKDKILQINPLLEKLLNAVAANPALDAQWLRKRLFENLYAIYYFYGRERGIFQQMINKKIWKELSVRKYGISYLKFMARNLVFSKK